MNREALIEYLPDASVDTQMDQQLRKLLSTCFTKPVDAVFKERRYFNDPYPHRWIIRGASGEPVAHVGVHERTIFSDDREYAYGGIAEVCVHPDHRGRGYVRQMLVVIHGWMKAQGIPFSILLGDPQVYSSSGYKRVDNIVHGGVDEVWESFDGLVCELGDESWPKGEVRLPGAKF